MLSSKEIRRKEFDKVKFGYQSDDVDAFLKQIEADYRSMEAEREESKKKIQLLAEKICHYKEQEEDLKNALLIAQRQARQIVDEAKEKAARIEEEARSSVDSVKAEAIASQELQLAELTKKVNRQNQALVDAHRQVSDFKHSLFDMYREHLKQLSALPDEAPEQTSAAPASETEEKAEDAKKTEEPAKAEENAPAGEPVKESAPAEEKADEKKQDAVSEPAQPTESKAESEKNESAEDTPSNTESETPVKASSFEAEIETVETIEAEIVSEEHPDEPPIVTEDKSDEKPQVNPEIQVEAVPKMDKTAMDSKEAKRTIDPFAQDSDSLPPPRTISHTAEFDTRYQNLRNNNRREEKKRRR